MKNLLDGLPRRVLKKLEKLSTETGVSVHTIVEHALGLYEKKVTQKVTVTKGVEALEQIKNDPVEGPIYDKIMTVLRGRSVEVLTPKQRKERARSGGNARKDNLSPNRRKSIAAAASKARWDKVRDEKAKAVGATSDASNPPKRLK